MKLNRLAELEHSDPKRFWADVTRIIRPRDDSLSCIEPWKWYKHFQSLLRPPAECDANSQFSKYVSGALPTLEGVSVPNTDLNKNFNADEIKDTIKDLKIGKATFLDELSNELFKFTFDTLCRPLLHLFNTILSMGDFPSPWSEGLIVPIHKKNDRLCVDNYRGIIISSCIGKVFIKILTKRIDNFMIDSGKWKINQCGFKPDHRTEDNLFILKSIHESYAVETNTNIHAAFIDFSKFFDTIDRMYLFYKLLKNNITGKVYNIIKSMYANPQYSVMVNGMISPTFTSSFGVKQGCCMSPVLSNIFQNDIHDIFSQDECDPVRLYDIYINSISWADDLLILSHSRKGLQTCLDKLHAYCSKWGLVVNQTKTKTMVFSKNKWQPEKFYYGNSEIECVKEIQYIGSNITHNMNIKNLITDRHKKAEKMSNLLLRALRTSKNVSAKLSLSLFDKYLSPILLYGCSIWGIPKSFKLIYLIEQPENNDTRKTVTRALTASCGYNIGFSSAKRVGKRCATKSRPILINLNCIQDAENILRHSGPYQFLPYEDRALPNIDAFHLNFCKKSLNISKYASNSAVLGELGRYPLTITCWSQVVKYWLRLVNGTNNVLLNSAFQMASHENHTWVQAIYFMLNRNGFKQTWLYHPDTSSNFHVIFKQCLVDQFIQQWRGIIGTSKRFCLLNAVKPTFQRSNYIDTIKSPDVRLTFTRLRVDCNVYSAYSRGKEIGTYTCPLCYRGEDSVKHLLCRCPSFQGKREILFQEITNSLPGWAWMNDSEKIHTLLDTRTRDDTLFNCCTYVHELYVARENVLKHWIYVYAFICVHVPICNLCICVAVNVCVCAHMYLCVY